MNPKTFGKFFVLVILAQLVSAVAFAAENPPSAIPCEAGATKTTAADPAPATGGDAKPAAAAAGAATVAPAPAAPAGN